MIGLNRLYYDGRLRSLPDLLAGMFWAVTIALSAWFLAAVLVETAYVMAAFAFAEGTNFKPRTPNPNVFFGIGIAIPIMLGGLTILWAGRGGSKNRIRLPGQAERLCSPGNLHQMRIRIVFILFVERLSIVINLFSTYAFLSVADNAHRAHRIGDPEYYLVVCGALLGALIAYVVYRSVGYMDLAATTQRRLRWLLMFNDDPPTTADINNLGDNNFRTRIQLLHAAKLTMRIAERLDNKMPTGSTSPSASIYRAVSTRITSFCASADSLSGYIPTEILELLQLTSAVLIGMDNATTMLRLARLSKAFDADGKPTIQPARRHGRGGRMFIMIARAVESTDRLASALKGIALIILATALVVAGQLNIEKLIR